MNPHRAKLQWLTVLILVACLPFACSPSSQQKAISTTLTAVNAASAAFVTFDSQHQQDIVSQATSKEAGQAALASYRAEQTKVATLFAGAYRAIAAAATVVNSPNIDGMIAAAALVAQELQSLGVKIP
jgi:hypothetical protein